MKTQFDQLLRSKGLKITQNRINVLQVLKQAPHPLDISEIRDQITPKPDTVTLYRMMDQFSQKGIVRIINFHEGKHRYELNHDHHHHLVCRRCGAIQAIHDSCLGIETKKIEKKYNFSIQDHTLEFFGLCQNCHQ